MMGCHSHSRTLHVLFLFFSLLKLFEQTVGSGTIANAEVCGFSTDTPSSNFKKNEIIFEFSYKHQARTLQANLHGNTKAGLMEGGRGGNATCRGPRGAVTPWCSLFLTCVPLYCTC